MTKPTYLLLLCFVIQLVCIAWGTIYIAKEYAGVVIIASIISGLEILFIGIPWFKAEYHKK